VQQVTLGSAGIEVSRFCLGCMYFGTTIDQETSFRLLDTFYEAGGRFLDTANAYAWWVDGGDNGISEALIGRWMKARGNRDEIILATKVGAQPLGTHGDWRDNVEGLSAAAIERGVEQSLERIQTDFVDLYYAHIDHRQTPLTETLGALNEVVRSGKARFLGCSNIHAWRLERARSISRANGWAEYCCLQQRFTYLRPKPGASFAHEYGISVTDEMLDYLEANDMPLVGYRALLQGAYIRPDRQITPEYQGPDAVARLEALRSVAEEIGATTNQVLYAWMMRLPVTIIPLVTASHEAHLTENLAALDVELTAEHMARLNEASG